MEKAKRVWINEDMKRKTVMIEIVKEDKTSLWFTTGEYVIRREFA